jgi:hypothetical protein
MIVAPLSYQAILNSVQGCIHVLVLNDVRPSKILTDPSTFSSSSPVPCLFYENK